MFVEGMGRRPEDRIADGHRQQHYDPVAARIWKNTKISDTSIKAMDDEILPD